MNNMIKQLQQANIDCSLEYIVIQDRAYFYYYGPEQEKKRLCVELSQIISEFLFTQVEKRFIRQMIDQQYQSPYPKDFDEIEKRIDQLFDIAEREVKAKRQSIIQDVYGFLEENTSFAVDGFIRFRTKPYQKWLRKLVRAAIDDYLLDREYKEFIRLLKYFVSIQKSRFLCVHVIHKEKKKFQLLKEDGTPIHINELDNHFHEMIGQSFSGEDFIVGALLSTAPEHVVIHTNSPDANIIRTLLQIFDGRITVCTGCQRCYS